MRKLSLEELQERRWMRALEIAKICFESEGYHTRYLDEIEHFIREHRNGKGKGIAEIKR
jgi:hypothetical protein